MKSWNRTDSSYRKTVIFSHLHLVLINMRALCDKFSVAAMYPISSSPFSSTLSSEEEQNILLVWWRDGMKVVSPVYWSARNCLHETYYITGFLCVWPSWNNFSCFMNRRSFEGRVLASPNCQYCMVLSRHSFTLWSLRPQVRVGLEAGLAPEPVWTQWWPWEIPCPCRESNPVVQLEATHFPGWSILAHDITPVCFLSNRLEFSWWLSYGMLRRVVW
jgi:hypothetical protein